MAKKIKVVFCYARKDEEFRLKIEQHLSVLRSLGVIALWHDQRILAGANWKEELERQLNAAHIVLLLVSPDFVASDFCFSDLAKQIVERSSRGEAHVIPIILRPIAWRGAPFGNLQALPGKAHSVTDWQNLDDALFHVAQGIKRAIGEIIIHQQPRSIALFGYEMQGGRISPLWTNPSAFSLDETYESWFHTKRNCSIDDIIGQKWVKTSNPEHTFMMQFAPDGTLKEYALSDPKNQWHGSWDLIDGIVRTRVSKYELDLFAYQNSSIYAGIEFAQDAKEPHSYFVCFPVTDNYAKHWDSNMVPELTESIFDHILHQRIDAKTLITYGALLCRGEMSVRSVVKILGLSQKYRERFVNTQKTEETVTRLIATFLGHHGDANRRQLYTKELQTRGSNVLIASLIDSEEYQRSFGEDTLPFYQRSS